MQNTNTRRGFTQTKSSRHAELVSASSRCQNKSHSRRFLSGIPTLFTARFVIPQGRYAGYSGRVGFTLIELLVVVLIIGILAAVALPQYQKAVEKSRATQAIQAVRTIAMAEKAYYLTHGQYTSNFQELDIQIPSLTDWDLSLSDISSSEEMQEWAHIPVRAGRIYDFDDMGIPMSDAPYFAYFLKTDRIACMALKEEPSQIDFCKSFATKQEECPLTYDGDGLTCFYFN